MDYNEVAKKWQAVWQEQDVFKQEPQDNPYYVLEMFPYPSGTMHMGHVRNYSIGDCVARYKRMQGHQVLYPMGFDAFGLPAENAAISRGADPAVWTEQNISEIKKQFKLLGMSYDWDREIATCRPEYYKWTQWLFLQLFKNDLAYRKQAVVNWDPVEQTVLANEQVVDGKGWRSGAEIEKKEIEQWFFHITKYAEELLDEVDGLTNWPDRVRSMQKNWIGKSSGTVVSFDHEIDTIQTFTTRADTLFGVTYIALAPEHPIAVKLKEDNKELEAYYKQAQAKSTIQRQADAKKKTGVFTDTYATHPLTGEKIPIWVADYVLTDYGTGAVMGVPAHDERDFAFAQAHDIEVVEVLEKPDDYQGVFTGESTLTNSQAFSGMSSPQAREQITQSLNKQDAGYFDTQYRLKDWLVSRQRYWGTPIPIVYCDSCGVVPVPEKDLPVTLPKDVEFGKGNPLETSESFINTTCPACGAAAKRETDTMDTFVDSSWYFLRFCDPNNDQYAFDKAVVSDWMPVNQYIGGIEHAVLHLLYARFFTKATRDIGLHDISEPFKQLLCQGMVNLDGEKMSKSKGNVVSPIKMINEYGPDAVRGFILFAAAPQKGFDWDEKGVEGIVRFLNRVEKLCTTSSYRKQHTSDDAYIRSVTHKTIQQVTDHLDKLQLNNAVSDLMQLSSELSRYATNPVHQEVFDECLDALLLMLSPIAPHAVEELWNTRHDSLASLQNWPVANPDAIDLSAEQERRMHVQTIKDVQEVLDMIGVKNPEKITLFVPAKWKYEFVEMLLDVLPQANNPGEVIKQVMQTDLKQHGNKLSKLIVKYFQDRSKLPEFLLSQQHESEAITGIARELAQTYNCVVEVELEEHQHHPKASSAMPGKPAIVVE